MASEYVVENVWTESPLGWNTWTSLLHKDMRLLIICNPFSSLSQDNKTFKYLDNADIPKKGDKVYIHTHTYTHSYLHMHSTNTKTNENIINEFNNQ